ncbi:unnamed protein product [Orchesella dallaii]|uniref:Uncharacterized protein n=1 Tax=Orchesella dallaii TaxID=48710 RepID=A0ABP1SAX2_9HEXA
MANLRHSSLCLSIFLIGAIALNNCHLFIDGYFRGDYITVTDQAIVDHDVVYMDCKIQSAFRIKDYKEMDEDEIAEALACMDKCQLEAYGVFHTVLGVRIYNSSAVSEFYRQKTNASIFLISELDGIYSSCNEDMRYHENYANMAGFKMNRCQFFELFKICFWRYSKSITNQTRMMKITDNEDERDILSFFK